MCHLKVYLLLTMSGMKQSRQRDPNSPPPVSPLHNQLVISLSVSDTRIMVLRQVFFDWEVGKLTLLVVNKLDQCKLQSQYRGKQRNWVWCHAYTSLKKMAWQSWTWGASFLLPALHFVCQASCNQRAGKPISCWKHSNVSIPADKPEWQGGIQSKKRCNLLYLHTKQKKGGVDTLRGYTAYGYCSSLNPRWGHTSMNSPSLIPCSPCPGSNM